MSVFHGSVAQRRSVSDAQQPEQSQPIVWKAEQVVAFGQEPHIAPWHLFMHARGLGLGGAWRVEAHHPPR